MAIDGVRPPGSEPAGPGQADPEGEAIAGSQAADGIRARVFGGFSRPRFSNPIPVRKIHTLIRCSGRAIQLAVSLRSIQAMSLQVKGECDRLLHSRNAVLDLAQKFRSLGRAVQGEKSVGGEGDERTLLENEAFKASVRATFSALNRDLGANPSATDKVSALFVFRQALSNAAATVLQGAGEGEPPIEASADFMESTTRAALVAAPGGAAVFLTKILSEKFPERNGLQASLKKELAGDADKLTQEQAEQLAGKLGYQAFGVAATADAVERLKADTADAFSSMAASTEHQLMGLYATLVDLKVDIKQFHAFGA